MRLTPLCFLLIACRPAPITTPAATVKGFYRAALATGHTGAPDPSALATLAPYLSDSLHALLAAARQRYESDRTRAPEEKPAFADGSLFSSLFEGPTTIAVVADSARGGVHALTTRMTHGSGSEEVTWSDIVLVGEEDSHLVITDIEFGGDWEFANRGSLRSMLTSALAAP